MLFNNPIGSDKADGIIRLLDLRREDRVLDAGCGTGEFLLRVAQHYGGHGVGVDRDMQCIASAREVAVSRGLTKQCDFQVMDVNELEAEAHSFDLAVCIGATHAFGSGADAYPNSINHLKRLVRPRGLVLIGEGYWKQAPAQEYLQLLGEPVGIYHDHARNVSFAAERGLTPLFAAVSSEDEWNDFEWSHHLAIRRASEANPSDAALAARLERSRRWLDGYLSWGRATMGFGLYLFRAPELPT